MASSEWYYATVVLLMVSSFISLTDTALADQVGPTISDVRWTPEEPYWDEGVNVSANVSDPDGLSYVNLQWCVGNICYPPVPMNHGAGDHYWYFARGPFPNGTVSFDILTEDTAGNPSTYKFNVTFRPRPSHLILTVNVHPDTVYPGETFTISGNLTLNTGEPPTHGNITVYLEDSVVGSGGLDPRGGFNISINAPGSVGNYRYRVVGEGDGFRVVENVSIRVIEKPLPDLVLTMHFTGTSRGESGIYLYPGDTFRAMVEVANTGTAPAENFTLIVLEDGTEISNDTLNISLVPEEVWSRNISFPAGGPGVHSVSAIVSVSAEEIETTNNNDTITYHVINPSAPRNQKVLVELFTSKTCEPCISSEHALDYLRYLRGENATVVAYVEDDPTAPSLQEITSTYGITGTPTVVFDGGYRVKVGGGDESALLEIYQRYLNESLTRLRPDITLNMSTVKILYNTVYAVNISIRTGNLDEELTGLTVTLYGVSPYLGPRGLNGVPIRYTISHFLSVAVPDLGKNTVYNLSLTPSWNVEDDGIVLVAALRGSGGEVFTHDRYEMVKKPVFYPGHTPREVKVPKRSYGEVRLTVEYFRYNWEENDLPLSVGVEAEMTAGGGFTIDAPDEVVITSTDLAGTEWGGRLEKYSAEVEIRISAGEYPSDEGLLLVRLRTTQPHNWSVNVEVRVALTAPEVVLLNSYVERKEDYMVITANFTNVSGEYVVQVEYVFYNEAVDQATSFSYLTLSAGGSYRGEIQIPGDYKKMRYRLYVRDKGEILYRSDWIEVKVPPSAGGGGEREGVFPYVASAVIAGMVILGAYLFVMRKRRALRGGLEE